MSELSNKWRALGLPWMPGMVDTKGRRVISCGLSWVDWADLTSLSGVSVSVDQWSADAVPDWTDPATVGCLLQMVRDAYGPEAYIDIYIGPHGYEVWPPDSEFSAPTLAGALIAALEAAQGEG